MRLVLALAFAALVAPARAAAPVAPSGETGPPSLALNEALEHERSGVGVSWSDKASGRAGTIRVERTFYRGQQPCRDFVWTQEAGGGQGLERSGTGCRVGKARWDIETKPAPPAPTAGTSTAPPPAPAAASGATVAAKPAAEPPLPARKPPVLVFTMPTRSEL